MRSCDIQPTSHMCILYITHMAFGDLQWGEGVRSLVQSVMGGLVTQFFSEPQNGHPAVTARCSDHKWTSHNEHFSCSKLWFDVVHSPKDTRTSLAKRVGSPVSTTTIVHNYVDATRFSQCQKPRTISSGPCPDPLRSC